MPVPKYLPQPASMEGCRPMRRVLLAAAVLLVAVSNNINWGRDHWRTVLQADAKGYYAYLPAVFIHSDLNFGFLEEAEAHGSNPNLHYDYRVNTPGGAINKYWCGTAVMQAPFFLVASGWAKLTADGSDGYGKPYVVALCMAAIFYALLGAWACARMLGQFGVEPPAQALVIAVLLFGTHLFYYVIVAPGMSHVYSFALVSLFLLSALRFMKGPRPRPLTSMGLLLGLIVLVRPVNGIIVLALPFLAGSRHALQAGLAMVDQHKLAAIRTVLLALGIFLVQPFIHYISTGSWWVDSYPGEHFNWTDPHPVDFLFSYKKGLFLYTPACLLACLGLYHIGKRSIFSLIAWLLFMAVLVYVLSSWWNWWYGGSFSARPMVEYLPLFAVPMGMAVQQLKGWARKGYVAALVLAIGLCQIQTFQARYYRIHYENMDRQQYWNEFLRLDKIP